MSTMLLYSLPRLVTPCLHILIWMTHNIVVHHKQVGSGLTPPANGRMPIMATRVLSLQTSGSRLRNDLKMVFGCLNVFLFF